MSKIREESRGSQVKGICQVLQRTFQKWLNGKSRAELLTDIKRDGWAETQKSREVFSAGRIWVPVVASPEFKS